MKIKRLLAVLLCVALISAVAIPTSAAEIYNVLTPSVHDHTDLPEYPCRENLANMENGDSLAYAYDTLLNGFKNFSRIIPVKSGTYSISPTELKLVISACLNDNPEIFWIPHSVTFSGSQDSNYNEYVLWVTPSYSITKTQAQTMSAELEASLDRYLVGLDDSMPEYTREKIIHDRMVAHITYDETTANSGNIYGALVEGKALCEGYARAFQYLLCRAGIQGYFVEGQANGVNHAWNLVKLEGDYYYVDITWDDPADDYPEIEETRIVDYAYFNVTTEELERTHVIESPWVPECTKKGLNFFSKRDHVLDTFDIDLIAEHLGKHNGLARFYILNDELYEQFWDLFDANFDEILEKSGLQFTADYISYGMSSVGYEVIPYIIGYEQNILYGNIVACDDGDATVTLTDANGEKYIATTEVVGHMGSFVVPNLPTGDYSIEVSIKDRYAYTQSVSVGYSDYIESIEFDMPYRYGDVTGDKNLDLRDLLRLKLAAAGMAEYDRVSFNMLENENFAEKLVELIQMLVKF